eukprot:4798323-Pyramimonas_sp.AAC.1
MDTLRRLEDAKRKADSEEDASEKEKTRKWRADIQRMCASSSIPYSTLERPDSMQGSKWYNGLPTREQHGIAYWARARNDMTFLDISQMPERMNPCTHATTPTITPSGRFMMFPPIVPEPRLLTGFEAMMLQGFPRSMLVEFIKKA